MSDKEMTLEQACATILGEKAARAIIADQGINWAAVAAIAAARTSHPPPALQAIKSHLGKIRAEKESHMGAADEKQTCPICGYDCAGANPPEMFCPFSHRKQKTVSSN